MSSSAPKAPSKAGRDPTVAVAAPQYGQVVAGKLAAAFAEASA